MSVWREWKTFNMFFGSVHDKYVMVSMEIMCATWCKQLLDVYVRVKFSATAECRTRIAVHLHPEKGHFFYKNLCVTMIDSNRAIFNVIL